MHIFEREVDGRKYRIAAQSIWNPRTQQPVSRQVVLGPAAAPAVADLSKTQTVGTRRVGDVGALAWIAEQLDVVGHIDRACPQQSSRKGPTLGEMVLAVAVQRACAPGAKRDLADFLGGSMPRLTLVSLARVALRTRTSARAMMRQLSSLEATMVRTTTGKKGRRPTVLIPPELSALQRKAVATFELDRWMPALSSTRTPRPRSQRAK